MEDKDLRRPLEGWSLDSLASHLVAVVTHLLAEVDKRYEQRFRAQEVAVDKAFIAQEKAIQMALTSAKEAVGKAEVAVEKRFDNTNEWRAAMQDRDRQQMPRVEIEKQFEALGDKRLQTVGILISALLGMAALIISLLRK